MILRRTFCMVVAAVLSSPSVLHAASPPIVGFLSLAAVPDQQAAFTQRLAALGYEEGRDVLIERRFAGGNPEKLISLATDLVAQQPKLIVANPAESVVAVRRVSKDIPVVFAGVRDPVGQGLIVSLGRPGGNTTGVATYTAEMASKQVDLLRHAIPSLRRLAILIDGRRPNAAFLKEESEGAARKLSLEPISIEVQDLNKIESAVSSALAQPADALLLTASPAFSAMATRIIALTTQRRLPTLFVERVWVESGGLMSYGPNYREMWRDTAGYADRILKGASPADLPVEQPTRLELVFNVKAARALGIELSPFLLAQADDVLE